MSREFKDAKDAEDPKCDKGPGHFIIVRQSEAYVIGHDGHEVDHAHHAPHEFAAIRGSKQPQQVLGSKDHDTGGVQAEETDLVLFPARLHLVLRTRLESTGHGLHHVGHH